MRSLLSVFLKYARSRVPLLMATAVLLSGFLAQPAAAWEKRDIAQVECALGRCWEKLFPEVRKAIADGAQLIADYQEAYREARARLEPEGSADAETEELALRAQMTLIAQYLSECQDLRRGADAPRHLILSGHHFLEDGTNNNHVAFSLYRQALEQVCGKDDGSALYSQCSRGIVVKQDMNKWDLYRYLKLLGPGSVKTVKFIGHSYENGLIVGNRDALLPSNWNPAQKITMEEWRARNVGNLLDDDLVRNGYNQNDFGRELSRVMAKDSTIELYGCNAGKGIAMKLQHVAPQSQVMASMGSMHFEYREKRGEGPWVTDWSSPIPAFAGEARMVADDGPDAFRKADRAVDPQYLSGVVGSSSGNPVDDAASEVTFKVLMNSANMARVDGGKRLVIFSREEQARLRELFDPEVDHHKLRTPLTQRLVQERFRQRIAAASDPQEADRLRKLQDKLEACVAESVRLYR